MNTESRRWLREGIFAIWPPVLFLAIGLNAWQAWQSSGSVVLLLVAIACSITGAFISAQVIYRLATSLVSALWEADVPIPGVARGIVCPRCRKATQQLPQWVPIWLALWAQKNDAELHKRQCWGCGWRGFAVIRDSFITTRPDLHRGMVREMLCPTWPADVSVTRNI